MNIRQVRQRARASFDALFEKPKPHVPSAPKISKAVPHHMRRHLNRRRIAEIIREHPSTAAELMEAEKTFLLSLGDNNVTLYTVAQQLGMTEKAAEIFLNERSSTVEAIALDKGYVSLLELGESHLDTDREMEKIIARDEAAQDRGLAATQGVSIIGDYGDGDSEKNSPRKARRFLKKLETFDPLPEFPMIKRTTARKTGRDASGGDLQRGTDGDDDEIE